MSPVLQEDDEKDENIPKMLCQMDNHLACVNCVRWSNSGMYLASGGDDKLIMVWKRATYIGPSTVFGSSGKLANVEQWRCVSILRSHSGDVMDVAWSPHDAWLASCSVDNTVVIWNAVKFPEILATLRGHSGLVKGLTWDPVGKYIASQADDRSLKVWRITPLCIAQLDTGDFSTAFFNSIPLSSSLAGTMLSSPSGQQLLPLDSSTPSFGASKPCTEPVAATSARPTGESVSKDSMNATSTPAASSPSVLTTPSKIEPICESRSRGVLGMMQSADGPEACVNAKLF